MLPVQDQSTGKAKKDRYIEGFLSGQTIAYCERVRTGQALGGNFDFPSEYTNILTRLVRQEGCKYVIEQSNPGRTSILIYTNDFAKKIFNAISAQDRKYPSEIDVWRTGKFFGYADSQIIKFIRTRNRGKQ